MQFTDPAAYPPVEHSAQILAERGWRVLLLGTDTFGNETLRLSAHPNLRFKKLARVKARWQQKLQYAQFIVWSLAWACIWRPQWIYASDPLSSPIATIAMKLTNARIIYHEHDSPNLNWPPSPLMKLALAFRGRLAEVADLCILPQRERLHEFVKQTHRRRPTLCVWNCPRAGEVQTEAQAGGWNDDGKLTIYYHGSINRSRLPPQLIIAASRFNGSVRLRLAGYETAGSVGYVDELMRTAAENGAPELIEWLGTIPLRPDLLRSAATASVGLSLMPKASNDINMKHMVGASNKPFDCMACGLPLLVSDLPDWKKIFVETGFARSCDPDDADSIEEALRWYLEHPDERRNMGRHCRDQIRNRWNYEKMCADVLAHIEQG